jgi:hypothetical protein
MAAESIRGLRGYDRLVMALNGRDRLRFGLDLVHREMSLAGFNADVVDVGDSSSHVETIIRALSHVEPADSFTAKDCDNYFELELAAGNYVAVADLHTVGKVEAGNKSYIVPVDGQVRRLAERQILSHLFCCGAYSFGRADVFLAAAGDRRYVSQVIMEMIEGGVMFEHRLVSGYEDWGTEEDWKQYRAGFMTLFVDIDGVLVQSSHRSFRPRWGDSKVIMENVEYLNELRATGKVEIILTTSRSEDVRQVTEEQLDGLQYDRLVMGLRSCARAIVNDVVPARGESSCVAVNIERDSVSLARLIGGLAGKG